MSEDGTITHGKIAFSDASPVASHLQFQSDGVPVFKINRDGTIWFNPDLSPEAGSQAAFSALMSIVRRYNGELLDTDRDTLSTLKRAVASMQEVLGSGGLPEPARYAILEQIRDLTNASAVILARLPAD